MSRHMAKVFVIRIITPIKYSNKHLKLFSTVTNAQIDYSNNNTNRAPLDVLKEKVDSGELARDEYQFKVATALQALHHEIESHNEPKNGIFSRLFQKKDLKSPKGLYIHGAVGGGKTLLMDMFFECCKVIDLYPILHYFLMIFS